MIGILDSLAAAQEEGSKKQEAIQKAEEHDFEMVNELLKVALAPFDEHPELEYLCKPTPMDCKNIKLSCSS